METVIIGIVGLIIGAVVGSLLSKSKANQQLEAAKADFEREKQKLEKEAASLKFDFSKAEKEADLIIKNAKEKADVIKKDRLLETREKFLQAKANHEKEVAERNKVVEKNLQKVTAKERDIKKKWDEVKKEEQKLQALQGQINKKAEVLQLKEQELQRAHNEQISQLEKISGYSAAEARDELVKSLIDEAKSKAKGNIKDILEEAQMTATKEARKVVIETVQRVATEQTIENCISVFNIENDEMKGRIIGREGRNIRALEAATGIEIIVDDTPEAIILSGFDPVRREIARLSLHKLVTDGRIHPARIEEVVNKTTKQLEEEMMEIGEKTVIDLAIHGLHPKLVRLIGKMRYRSSYGQNLLQHSREVANFCAIMAAELGLNIKLAKRAGLLHDIGKVAEDDNEMPHALLGAKIAEKYNENPIVVNAIGAHHEEIEMTSPISPIVQVCDAISGARPGARREVVESYIQRLKDLEKIALSYDGVQKTYAIQAGRELRVIVESEKVKEADTDTLSFEIAQRIQDEMTYPGQVKVTVIREKRSIAFAK